MISRGLVILGLFLAALPVGEAALVAAEESTCSEAQAQWAQTYESLKEAMNALREAQAESIEPRINHALTDGTRLSVAQKVQTILKDRNKRIYEAALKSANAADEERGAFEQLRKCSGSDSSRRSASRGPLNAIARERNKLLADLHDLLLDEAYVQYKRESPNPQTYSGHGPDQQSAQNQYQQSGPGGQMGYDAYAPGYGYQ